MTGSERQPHTQRTPSLRECEALLEQASEPGSVGNGGGGIGSLGADAEALGAWAGWAFVGGPFGELLGGAMGRWIGGEQQRMSLAEAERRGACTIEWLTQAARSLDEGRPIHAVSHARKAARLTGVLAEHARSAGQATAMRPHALFTLVRALEAANGGEATAESGALLREVAKTGHSSAQVELAERLEVSAPAEAVRWYEEGAPGAADGGVAWRRLGVMLLTGAGAEDAAPRYDRAAAAFETASNLGDAEGAYNLGRMYEWRQAKGKPVPKPTEDAEAGGTAAADAAAGPSSQGEGGTDSAVAAEVNALGGSSAAESANGKESAGDAAASEEKKLVHSVEAPTAEIAAEVAAAEWRDQSLRLYELAASRGLVIAHPAAARLLLLRARAGDAQQACAHYTAAAEADDADSQWELAGLLREGVGCKADAQAAEHWLAAAAANGHPAALAGQAGT